MKTTINTDPKSVSEWNAFIDSLLLSGEHNEALSIAIKSESIWKLFLQFRSGEFKS